MKQTKEERIDYATWTQEQFAEDMQTNPKYTPFFEPYAQTWVEHFMENHAKARFKVFSELEANRKSCAFQHNQIIYFANLFLDEILEKKLFNLQCFWRAGEIKLPYIRLTSDFNFLSKDIRTCPFLEPITEEELAIGLQFLREQPYWTPHAFIPWQNYDTFKENIDNDEDTWNPNKYPMFYEHFDLYEKTGYFWNLPNKRGEIENNYRSIGYNEKKKLDTPLEEPKEISVLKDLAEVFSQRYLFYTDRTRKDFVENCEDDQIKEAVVMDESFVSYNNDDFDLESALHFLNSFEEEIPMAANENWQDAIKETAILFKNRKILEALPEVYKTYRKEFEGQDPKQIVARRTAAFDPTEMLNYFLHQYIKDEIILARRSLGEPENLDYMDF